MSSDMNLDKGVIEKFFQTLPEKALNLGVRVLLAAVVLFLGIQIIKLFRRFLRKALQKSKVDASAVKFLDSFIKYGAYFVLIMMIASWLGVDAASIIALLGSASVAIGLALQGSLSNLAGGVLILILKPFKVGDYIKDEKGNEGTVDSIDIFYTHLLTFDNKVIVLPNGALVNGSITNFTGCTERRIDILVGISYQADIKKAKSVLEKMLKENTDVLKDKELTVFVDSLGDSAIMLNVRCWTKTENYKALKAEITENIKYALDTAKIEIPYPQMDIHVNN